MQTSNYLSVWDCIHDSTHPSLGGLRALYTGYLSIIVRDLPYFSLQLGCYDNFKNILSSTVVSPLGAKMGFRLSPQNIELIASVASGFIVSDSIVCLFV